MRALPLAILGLCLGLGCSPAPSQSAWVRANGGLAGQTHLAKAQAAFALLGAEKQSIHVSVINSDTAGAYAWPGGDVFVTRGLVDLLDEQELAAALAHEMGHLIADHTANPPSSLHGVSTGNAAEISADTLGMTLLQKQGMNRDVMISMLRKVRGCNPTCRNAIQERIDIVSR